MFFLTSEPTSSNDEDDDDESESETNLISREVLMVKQRTGRIVGQSE